MADELNLPTPVTEVEEVISDEQYSGIISLIGDCFNDLRDLVDNIPVRSVGEPVPEDFSDTDGSESETDESSDKQDSDGVSSADGSGFKFSAAGV